MQSRTHRTMTGHARRRAICLNPSVTQKIQWLSELNERNIPVTRFITEVTNNLLLQEIIENSQEERDKHSRSWTPRLVSLAFVLYVTSPKSYWIQKKHLQCHQFRPCISEWVQNWIFWKISLHIQIDLSKNLFKTHDSWRIFSVSCKLLQY
jgi:hypothetical protein